MNDAPAESELTNLSSDSVIIGDSLIIVDSLLPSQDCMNDAPAESELTNLSSDSVIIGDSLIIGEKDIISRLRNNKELYQNWLCAEQDDVSITVIFNLHLS